MCNNRLMKRIELARWVRHWVCPWIVGNFNELAVYLPEFAESRPAGLQPRAPESVRFSRKTLTFINLGDAPDNERNLRVEVPG